jgi:hypothetical protein
MAVDYIAGLKCSDRANESAIDPAICTAALRKLSYQLARHLTHFGSPRAVIKFFKRLGPHQQPYSDAFIWIEIAALREQRYRTT